MILTFVLWIPVLVGVARNWRWTPGLGLLALVSTVITLRIHMTADIPLFF